MRILHLLDTAESCTGQPGAGDAALVACRELISGQPGADQHVCLIGDGALERRSARLGLNVTDRIVPPLRRVEMAWAGVRSLARDRARFVGRPWPDLVQCYSVGTLLLARLAMGGRAPRVGLLFNPSGCPSVALRRGAPAPIRHRICAQALDGAVLLAMAPRHRADQPDGRGIDRVVRIPPLRARWTPSDQERGEVRRAMSLGESDIAVGVIGDPLRAIDAAQALWIMAASEIVGRRIVGLLPAESRGSARARRLRRAAGHPQRLIIVEGPVPEWLAACDVAFCMGRPEDGCAGAIRDPGAEAVIACGHAMGVPVVAPVGVAGAELWGPAAGTCVALNCTRQELVRAVVSLVEDGDLRRDVTRRLDSVSLETHAFVEAVGGAWNAVFTEDRRRGGRT